MEKKTRRVEKNLQFERLIPLLIEEEEEEEEEKTLGKGRNDNDQIKPQV